MKIYLANESKQTKGGGWTFISNLQKGLQGKVEFVDNLDACDVYFVSGATMVTREQVKEAKDKGKKIVLRIDGIPRNSRNRNTGTSRLFDFAQMADLVIYQSEWSKMYVGGWLKKEGPVILNGVNTSIFRPEGETIGKMGSPQYIYVRYNRDETKQFHRVWYEYQLIYRKNPNANLWIIGKFSEEQKEYNFDFYNGEKYRYWGVIDTEMMSILLRSADIFMYSYYMDACSNSLIEAIVSGIKIWYMEENGSAKEIKEKYEEKGSGYFGTERMCAEYFRELRRILS